MEYNPEAHPLVFTEKELWFHENVFEYTWVPEGILLIVTVKGGR